MTRITTRKLYLVTPRGRILAPRCYDELGDRMRALAPRVDDLAEPPKGAKKTRKKAARADAPAAAD